MTESVIPDEEDASDNNANEQKEKKEEKDSSDKNKISGDIKSPSSTVEGSTESDTKNNNDAIQMYAEPKADEPTEDSVSVDVRYKEKIDASTEDASSEIAEFVFTEGVNESGYTTGKEIKIYAAANPGWKLVSVQHMIKNADGTDGTPASTSGSNGVYTLSTATKFTGDIVFTVTAERVKPKLKKDSSGTPPAMYLIGTAKVGGTEIENPEITADGLALDFDPWFSANAEISVAVKKEGTNEYGTITPNIETQSNSAAKKAQGTEKLKLNGASEETDCVVFTFKPSDLTGYDSSVNSDTNAFTLTWAANAADYALGVASAHTGASPAASWEAEQVNSAVISKFKTADTARDYKYFTLNGGVDGFAGDDASTAKTFTRKDYDTTSEDSKNKKNILIFNVKAATDKEVNIVKVWAELSKGTSPNFTSVQKVDAVKRDYKDGDDTKYCYTIDLSEFEKSNFTEAMTMIIKAETEYKTEDDGFKVHNIRFTGDLENVEIKASDKTATATFDSAKDLKTVDTIDTTPFNFAIRAKTGFVIKNGTEYSGGSDDPNYTANKKVVTVSYEKRYEITTGSAPNQKKYYFKEYVKDKEEIMTAQQEGSPAADNGIYVLSTGLETARDSVGFDAGLKKLAKDQNNLSDSDITGVSNANLSLKNIEINVQTVVDAENKTGTVRIVDCPDDMKCEITGTDVTVDDKDPAVYYLDEDAGMLVVNITSEVTPTVEYQTGAPEAALTAFNPKYITRNGDVYTAKIPVKGLYIGADGKIDAAIKIGKALRYLDVDEKLGDDAAAEFTGSIRIDGAKNEPIEGVYSTVENADGDDGKIALTEGKNITVTLTAIGGRLFEEASYKLAQEAADAEAHPIVVSDDGKTASFEIKVTDDINVTAKTKKTLRYVVKYNNGTNDAVLVEDGVYAVPAGTKTVTIEAYTSDSGSDKQVIEYVKVFDGSEKAASTAVKGSGADTNKITVTLSDKDSEQVRVQLKAKEKGKLVELPSVSIRRDKSVSELSIVDRDGNPVDSLTVLPGAAATELIVNVVSGNFDFKNGSIGLELARDASKTGDASGYISSDSTEVEFDKINAVYNSKTRKLTIKGLANSKGNDRPLTLRFFDKDKRAKAAGETAAEKLGLIAGSEITVKLDSPAIVGITPEVEQYNTVRNLQLVLSTPGFGGEKAENGKDIYYRISVTGTVREPHTGRSGAVNDRERLVVENEHGLDTIYSAGNEIDSSRKTFYIRKRGESQEILLPVNYQYTAETNTVTELKTGQPQQSYDLVVDLVYALEDGNIKDLGNSDKMAGQPKTLRGVKTAKEIYQAKLELNPIDTTVYTGQEEKAVAKAAFDNEEGVRQLRTEIINTETGLRTDVSGLWARAGLDGTIYVGAENMQASKNLPKNIGVKVSAVADATQKSADAVISLKFVNGVGSIGFVNGTNRVLYKKEGKDATLKIKAVLNEVSGVKPKNSKITYVLADTFGNEVGSENCALSANLLNSVSVNRSNGTVKVSKKYQHDAKNCAFRVIAKTAGREASVWVTISEEAQQLGDIVVVDGTGRVVARDGGTLKKEDFQTAALFVRVLRSNVPQNNNKYSDADYAEGISVTSGTKKALAVSSATGRLTMLASSNKAVKLTAVNTDGSKKDKRVMTVNLAGPAILGADVRNMDGETVFAAGQGTTYKYSGALKERFAIQPRMKVGTNWINVPADYYRNIDVKIKGGKKIAVKNANYFEVLKTAAETTITISDKTNKDSAVVYTIEQSPATPTKGKTLTVKSETKITQQMVDSARSAANWDDGQLKLKFRITGKTAAEDYGNQFIMFTPDYSKTKLFDKMAGTEEYVRANEYFLGGDGQEAIRIEADGTFELWVDMFRKQAQERIPGTYVLNATVGTFTRGGEFEPMDGVKATSVKIKIPGKAPKKIALEMKESTYALSTAGEAVDLAKGISSGYAWDVDNAYDAQGNKNPNNLAKNKVNADGTVNNFRKYFEVRLAEDGRYMLGMASEIPVEDLKALVEGKKDNDLEGYVTVTSYNRNVAVETKDMPIKIDLTQPGGLTAAPAEAYRGAKATVTIDSADSRDIALYGVALDKSSVQAGADAALETDKAGNDVLRVQVPSNAGESYTVNLRVLTANSAYARAKNAPAKTNKASAKSHVEKYGEIVPVTVTVCDPATAQSEVEVLTAADDVAFRAEATKAQYTADTKKYNSYFDNTGSRKKYVLRVDVKSKIDGAQVSGVSYDKTFTDKTITDMISVTGSNDEILLTLDQEKFIKACDPEGAITKGGTVSLPLTAKFNLKGLKDSSLTLEVQLPDPKSFEEAKADLLAAESEITNMKPDEFIDPETDATNLANLQRKINEVFRAAVPLDTEAYKVTPEKIELPADREAWKDGKYKQTVTIQAKSAKNTDVDYNHDFEWTLPSETQWTAAGLITAIEDMLKTNRGAKGDEWLEAKINALEKNKSAGITVNNDYTKEAFLSDLTELLKENGVTLGSNMSINVTTFTRARATWLNEGTFTIKISAYDSKNKVTEKGHDYEITVNIPKVIGIGEEGTNVIKAIDEINFEEEIYKALGECTDVKGLEGMLVTVIENKAKSALTNKNIGVELAVIEAKSGETNYVADSKNVKIAYKLPGINTGDGHVRYELHLQLTGVKDYVIKRTDDANYYDGSTYKNHKVELDHTKKLTGGVTFQMTTELETALSGQYDANADNPTNADADKILKAYTPANDDTPADVTFKEGVEVKANENATDKVSAALKNMLKKVVTGMYLEVSVENVVTTDATNYTGKVKVTDRKHRDIYNTSDASVYTFTYKIPKITTATDAKESTLEGIKCITKEKWDGMTGDIATNRPSWDHVSGLQVGEAKKTGTNEYTIPLTGTLRYVEGWTGFNGVNADEQKGYYTGITIPVPTQLKGTGTERYFQVIGNKKKSFTKTGINSDGSEMILVSHFKADASNSAMVNKGTESKIRGFKLLVDYDGLTVIQDVNGYDNGVAAGVAGSPDHAMITYIFDMSGVTLENKSEAKIKVISQSDTANFTELKDYIVSLEGTAADAAKINVSGSNNDGKSSVIKVKGTVPYMEIPGFYRGREQECKGYYVGLVVEAPANVKPKTITSETVEGVTIYKTNAYFKMTNAAIEHGEKVQTITATAANGDFEKKIILVLVNDADMSYSKNNITIEIDWDGNTGADTAWTSTKYSLDLSEVVYGNKPAAQ